MTLNAVDQLNVGGLLNKNGTSSDGGRRKHSCGDDWWQQQHRLISVIQRQCDHSVECKYRCWLQIGDDIDGEADGDIFGQSVSMSADGRTLVGASAMMALVAMVMFGSSS